MANDPIGNPQPDILKPHVDEVVKSWQDVVEPLSWWERLWGQIKGSWLEAVNYIIRATDYFVNIIDEIVESGPDKKATVLDALSQVYDAIVPQLLPLALRPFNSKIKAFVINVVISLAIDFVVEKYRSGEWQKKTDLVAPKP